MTASPGQTFMDRAKCVGFGVIIGLLVAACAWAWLTPKPVIEAAAPAARQADGSLVLERAPSAKLKPAHVIPKGSKPERTVSVNVQPARADCPICTVDLTLVRMPDGTRRVVASSTSGSVLGGLDSPSAPLFIDKEHHWAVGASHGTDAESWGLWVDRDISRIRIGGEVNKTGTDNNGSDRYEARIKIGFKF